MFGLVWEACRAGNQLWGWSCPSPGNTCLGSSPACRDRRSPNPDLPCSVEGSLSDALTMSPFTCMAHKHCHNPTSWAVAKASTNSGGTVRSQKLDLGATKNNNNNNNHADWKSGTAGMRSKRTDCSVVFFSKKDLTNPGVQSVTPTLASPPHCSLADVCGTPDWVRHALATSPGKGELERSRGQWCPRPVMADFQQTDFGQTEFDLCLWLCVCLCVCLCVFVSVCVCLCGVGVGFTVSVCGFQGFGLVMFGAPGTPFPGPPFPGPPFPGPPFLGPPFPGPPFPWTAAKFALFFPLWVSSR